MYTTSCATQKTFKYSVASEKYYIQIPSGYQLSKTLDDHGYFEHRFLYPDSSVIYVTDDIGSGGAMNYAKVEKYGQGIFLDIIGNDTLDINGEKEGRFWREKKIHGIVLGYLNANNVKKREYDKMLINVRSKK